MNNHFIKNIEIKNFKCFENFTAEGFGRVNLIGGKNNVGKTTFIEACYANVRSKSPLSLIYALSIIERNRDGLNFNDEEINLFKVIAQYKSFDLNSINKISYKFNDNYIKKQLIIKLNNETEEVSFDKNFNTKITFEKEVDVLFIGNSGLTNSELEQAYEIVQKQEKEDLINDYLKKFDENILKFKIMRNKGYIKQKKDNEYYELHKFGDGVKQYIFMIISLYATKNSYLFIDEIENGIHYTNLDELWEIILTVSKEQNVQVFATTHSKECIESYARVAKKLEDEEVTFIELGRNKNNELASIVYDFEAFLNEVEQNQEIRGW